MLHRCKALISKFFVTLLFVLLLFTAPLALRTFAQEPKLQVWHGVLDTPDASIRLRFELKERDGELGGIVLSPDQGNAKLRIQTASINGDEFSLTLKRPKATFAGTLSEDRQTATGEWKQGKTSFPLEMHAADADDVLELPPAKQVWKGSINAGIKLAVQLRVVVDPETDEEVCYFDSLSQGSSGLKATRKLEDGKLLFEVPVVKGKFEGTLDEAKEIATGTWSQGFVKLPLKLEKTETAEEAKTMNRPQHPLPPYAYNVEEIKFPSKAEDVTLAGSLTMPKNAKPDGKLTAAILISGSGPQDRDESIMGHKPFLVIADHLTKKGFAVLRFDDRGTAASTGDHETATTANFADDVLGALEFLRSRPEINSKRIGLIGHSEGGLIGPLAATQDPDVGFVVLLAGPGVNGEKIILNQSQAIARAAGESEAALEVSLKYTPRLIEAVKNDASEEKTDALLSKFAAEIRAAAEKDGDDELPSEEIKSMLMGSHKRMNSPWFRFFLTHEPVPVLEKISCPVLSVIGEKDIQVDPKLNNEPLEAAIAKAGNPKSEHRELPGLNHLFQECETGALDEYLSIEQTFSPAALEIISNWISALD